MLTVGLKIIRIFMDLVLARFSTIVTQTFRCLGTEHLFYFRIKIGRIVAVNNHDGYRENYIEVKFIPVWFLNKYLTTIRKDTAS